MDFLLTARSFREYCGMFDLTDDEARSGLILDCASGAASFGATARRLGASVVCVDPALAVGRSAFVRRARGDHARAVDMTVDNPAGFVWTWFPSMDDYIAERTGSLEVLAEDLASGSGSYVAAVLPHLPFADRVFDRVLISHLLSLYADELSLDFHVDALRELSRVSRGEVRMFPLVEMDGSPFRHLDAVRAALQRDGLQTTVRQVPYEFQSGSTRMLIVSR